MFTKHTSVTAMVCHDGNVLGAKNARCAMSCQVLQVIQHQEHKAEHNRDRIELVGDYCVFLTTVT